MMQPTERVEQDQARSARPAWPLPWWSTLSLVLLVALVTALAWIGLTLSQRPPAPAELPTPIFIIVTSLPGGASAPGQSQPETEATQPAPGQARPGDVVQVSDTGGLGVRLRAGPGVLYETLKIVPEGSRLELVGEARQADDHVWRLVRDPTDGVQGWMVVDYLQVIAP
ncbi:MAG: hypothetical protein JW850_01480 [Thermoflexales bacterium]|nr:hypothetical protein [Thermoflexales bacterium]